jgi:Flp pilus assembly pilin Flp
VGAAILVIVIVVVIALVFVAGYNGLVRLRNRIDSAWSQIGVQLERRHDLIPNLIETVKGYAAHEKTTLEGVVQARNAAIQAKGAGPEQQAEAENVLTGALKSLFALAEAHLDRGPDRVRPPVLQRQRDEVRQQDPVDPVEHHRRHVRVQGTRVLPGGAGRDRGSQSRVLSRPQPAGHRPGAVRTPSR